MSLGMKGGQCPGCQCGNPVDSRLLGLIDEEKENAGREAKRDRKTSRGCLAFIAEKKLVVVL